MSPSLQGLVLVLGCVISNDPCPSWAAACLLPSLYRWPTAYLVWTRAPFLPWGSCWDCPPPNPVIPCCRACHAAGGNFWSISVFNVYRVCVLLGIFLCFKKASLCIFPSRSPFPSLLRLPRKPVKPPKLLNRQYLVTPKSWSHSCFVLLTKTQCGSLQEFFFLLLIIASLW